MATASQVTALIRSYKENDRERFLNTAIQVAAHEAQVGHGSVAHEIRQLVDAIKNQTTPVHARLSPFNAQNSLAIAELAILSHPKERLSELVLPYELIERIKKIVLEYQQRAKLQAHGMAPRRKALLAGPSGTGKSLSARVLSSELHLPLYTVLMDKLVTKFMGETGAKLRQIFACMGQMRGVYLFDEFDAIGGERSRDNDVGEMRRVLNTFLQLLEQDDSESLIIAATNEINILDNALFRRFDDVLYYNYPDDTAIKLLLSNNLGVFWKKPKSYAALLQAANALSPAEIAQACADAVKDAILNDRAIALEEDIIQALHSKQAKYRPAS